MSTPKELKPGCTLMNGEEKAAAHPGTFIIPSIEERRGVQAERLVKIGIAMPEGSELSGERFWVEVQSRDETSDGPRYLGRVDNALVASDVHGIKLNNVLAFGPAHILDLYQPTPQEEWADGEGEGA